MLPLVLPVLRASAAVTDMVADRIYRHGATPQGVSRPYVTWQAIAGVPQLQLSGVPYVDRVTIQVDCWHDDDDLVETLAKAVRDAIEPVACMTGMPLDGREPDTKLYRIALQFDWFVGRSS